MQFRSVADSCEHGVVGFARFLLVVAAGCYAPAAPEGAPCGDNGTCPSELRCDPATNRCVRDIASIDARVADSAIDAPPDVSPDAAVDAAIDAAPPVCTSVLIYDDCAAPDADCETIAEPLRADNAALALGFQVKYGGVGNQGAFRNLAAAGDYDVMIVESSLAPLAPATADAIATWVNSGGRTIISYWDLDNAAEGVVLRGALNVSTPASVSPPRNVYPEPASPVNLFANVESVPTPLVFTELMVDDGDELAVAQNAGFIAARQGSTTGAGAITVTRNERAITLGFVPVGLVFQGPRDADNDGKPDVQELYTNLLSYLCAD